MKILISGAEGQLGKDLVQVLEGEHNCLGLGKSSLDITESSQVGAALQKFGPEAVINAAAFTKVDAAEAQREMAWRVNAEGPKILAAHCEALGIPLFHVSTDYLFDGQKPPSSSYSENDPVGPLSYYGTSKLGGERSIAAETDNFAVVRTAWLYGLGGPNFLKTMLRLALQGKSLKVVDDQFGAPTWTHRLALQLKTLVERQGRGIYHATAAGATTWYQTAKFFLTEMGIDFDLRPCTTEEYPTPAIRPKNSILENSRLKEEGIDRMVDWRQDVASFVELNRGALLAEAKGGSA
jgi:dTDP-4-dehydrorhamnose reductase